MGKPQRVLDKKNSLNEKNKPNQNLFTVPKTTITEIHYRGKNILV